MQLHVEIDTKHQVIRQALSGDMTEEGAFEITRLTSREAEKLNNPSEVRLLVDGRFSGKLDAKARRVFVGNMRREDLKGMAFYGTKPYVRAILNFLLLVSGTDKVRYFDTEEQALAWLLQQKAK